MTNKGQNYSNIIKALINSPENIKKSEDIFKELRTNKIYIYGAGNVGATTFKLLRSVNMDIAGFFDRNGGNEGCYCEKNVYKADRDTLHGKSRERSLIIVAFICSRNELKDIQRQLLKYGWEKIYYFYDIYNCLICNKPKHGNSIEDKNNFGNCEIEKILKVASFMEDDESFEIYERFFKAILSSNPEYLPIPSKEPQYFVDDVPFKKGYSRFIDCGAFDGDTAYSLKKYKGGVEALVMFEPDSNNFGRLCSNLKSERVASEQMLFPCGVWKNSQMLKFKSGIQTSSGISDDGDTFIQCIAIDEVISDFAPTFIKMDIEGAECEALQGSAQTIRKYHPDLAISAYHRIEDLWEIPLLIKDIDPEYRFYLRSHGAYGIETILYAIN